ncbi:MAG: hypothetical protein JWP91_3619 [Fibrobacteres bacterium]|nr:hypothetical protein [Fibrobacterota bacterium]
MTAGSFPREPDLKAALPAALLALAMGLASCARNDRIAGATSETTNGDLKAAVSLSDGTPAARVRVLLVDDEDWLGKLAEGKSVILDSAYTDSAGTMKIRVPLSHRCNLQIDGPAEGAFLRNVNALFDTAGLSPKRAVTLAAYGGISGRARSDIGSARELHLNGSAYTAPIRADSSYSFDRVPAGSFAIVALINQGGILHPFLTQSIDVAAGVRVTGQDVGVPADRILVDDFALGWKQTALGRILGDGLWYTATDIGDAGNSSIKVDFITDSLSYDGSSVRAQYVLGSRLRNPWAIMGFNIGTSLKGAVYDFSDLKAITFMAKGSGWVNVKFLSKAVSRDFADSVHYYYPLHLPAEWTRITIPVDSLIRPAYTPAAALAITWQQAAKEMATIDFTVELPKSDHGDTTVFWVDQIHLEGISLERIAH